MNYLVRRISNPLSSIKPRSLHWSAMTEEEQNAAMVYLREKLASQMDDYTAILQCSHINITTINIVLLYIHVDIFNLLLREVTTKPYIIIKDEDCYRAHFLQNLERLSAMVVPSPHIARSAVRDALRIGGTCAISLESFTELNKFCVGICGHIFSMNAHELTKCPTCREPIAWAVVRRDELSS